MPKLTFFPLGNADTILIDLANGKKVLFDFADIRCCDDDEDVRIDLSAYLKKDLKDAKRSGYDVLAITHLDNDHTCKAHDFFFLDHAQKYQGEGRAKIGTLWVPAAVILESRNDLEDGAKALQAEARYRLLNNYGIRVFSRPDALEAWLADYDIPIADRETLITDAGNVAPELSLATDSVEFFVHSPFGWRQDENTVIDRNGDSLVMQATFVENDVPTQVMLGSDVAWDALSLIVQSTTKHQRTLRLCWDVFKLPHHCSYKTLSKERGEDQTAPVDDVKTLFEKYGQSGCIIVSPSKVIPAKGSEDDKSDQPPHRQAANYYRSVTNDKGGQFLVTMEQPNKFSPKPIVIIIDRWKATVQRAQAIGPSAVTSVVAPRAG